MQADGSTGNDGVDLPIGFGQPARSHRAKPVALWQIPIQHERLAVIQATGDDSAEPVALLGAGVDLPIGAGVQVDELRPRSLLKAQPRSLLEVPNERHARVVAQHFVSKRYCLPVKLGVNHIRL